MDFQKIKYFISVARHLSFTKGAQECHVSQTVISRQIAAMEDELGVPLFIRSGHKIELTPAGDAFYCEAVYMLQHYNSVVERLKKLKPGIKGNLNIGFGPLESGLLEKVLPKFMESYPDIIVNCQQFSYNALPFRYTRGLLDVVMTTEKCANTFRSISDAYEVFPNKWLIAAHEGHAFWELKKNEMNMLKGQALIVLETDFDDEFEYKCLKQNFKIKSFIQTNFLQSMVLMLEARMGIAFVPAFLENTLPFCIKTMPIELADIESAFTMSRRVDNVNPCVDLFIAFANEILVPDRIPKTSTGKIIPI